MMRFDIFRLNLPISISGLGVGIDDCFVYTTCLNLWLNFLLTMILHFTVMNYSTSQAFSIYEIIKHSMFLE